MENINKTHTPIKNWDQDDRPREKMLKQGPNALSNAELLAILINNGTRSLSALDLARELLRRNENKLNVLARQSVKDLQKTKGIGPAKAIVIKAALQLAVCLAGENLGQLNRLSSSREVAEYLRQRLQHENHEVFLALYLNQGNKIMGLETISEGGMTATVVDVRIVVRKALEYHATSIILCHNHPSGNLQPSQSDRKLTDRIKAAAQLLDITVLDHLIVSDRGYYSFADEGIL